MARKEMQARGTVAKELSTEKYRKVARKIREFSPWLTEIVGVKDGKK